MQNNLNKKQEGGRKMRWQMLLKSLFLSLVTISICYAKTMFYTHIRASTVTSQTVSSMKELPNKRLVFISRGDQSVNHFAIGFLDTLGNIVDYVTYDNGSGYVNQQISVSPDGSRAILSGIAAGGSLISPWRDPRIMSFNLNTNTLIWGRNFGPGCVNGSAHAVKVIDNSSAIVSYSNYNNGFFCSGGAGVAVIERVSLNSYSIFYRNAIRKTGSNQDIKRIFQIVNLPVDKRIALLATGMTDYVVGYGNRQLIVMILDSVGNIIWRRLEPFSHSAAFRLSAAGFSNQGTYASGYKDAATYTTAFIAVTSDSGILVAGSGMPSCDSMYHHSPYLTNCSIDVQDNTSPYHFGLVRTIVIKFDKNLNIQWARQYYSNNFSIQPNGLGELSDGYILGAVVGHYETSFYRYIYDTTTGSVYYYKTYNRYYHPALIKIDKTNGNVIWSYKYIPIADTISSTERIAYTWHSAFDNSLITKDSGIVVYGTGGKFRIIDPKPHMSINYASNNYTYDTYFLEQFGWILKTDNNGNTCPSITRQAITLYTSYYNFVSDNSTTYYTENYNFSPGTYTPTLTTGLYYNSHYCYITPVSNNESNNCSSKEFKLLNNKIVFDQEREFKIYSIEGKLIYSGKSKEYVIKKDGIYILKINNNTYKILIK